MSDVQGLLIIYAVYASFIVIPVLLILIPVGLVFILHRECLQRDVEPDELAGGELGNWLRQNAESLPPLRLRERAWMQLLADDIGPETSSIYTTAAERLDKPEPVRRQIR